MTRINLHPLGVVLIAFLGFASPAHGQLLNPDFETGNFTNWQTSGNCAVMGTFGAGPNAIAPDSGSFQAVLLSQPGSTVAAPLETFLGLAPGAIAALDPVSFGGPTQGSAIKQTITVVAGSTLTIRYNGLPQKFCDTTPEVQALD